jgi:hypothetical protein
MNSIERTTQSTQTLSAISERYDKAIKLAKTIQSLPKLEPLTISTWRWSRPSVRNLESELHSIRTDLNNLSEPSDPMAKAKIAVQISELQSLIDTNPHLKTTSTANSILSRIGLAKPRTPITTILKETADSIKTDLNSKTMHDYYNSILANNIVAECFAEHLDGFVEKISTQAN